MKMVVVRHRTWRAKNCVINSMADNTIAYDVNFTFFNVKTDLDGATNAIPGFLEKMILQRHITMRMPGNLSWLKYTDCNIP